MRELEYMELASYNTFYTKSFGIYSVLMLCAFKKSKFNEMG